ncbi:very hypothetical proline-rich protein [Laccaria bicolor S238N-H82]|uniref:Very hypothetical proline-rich protein n=1 Tax=Laccaria bicolor (strain S238N-H82 / ATCC MYA-4686) TaxID=486041 RepID=B0E273_LACBS|nr:very hypothetical proline-rich protein [Laccaria bicolor S238N-H82]EDQ99045.1 very hypothetical proline-rich protein [Laccaria bicolor S238N-H82]|eukprot:XP_001890288.1 very hypothetical proline-rich protein [Laccaria bicolor S238N-H82]
MWSYAQGLPGLGHGFMIWMPSNPSPSYSPSRPYSHRRYISSSPTQNTQEEGEVPSNHPPPPSPHPFARQHLALPPSLPPQRWLKCSPFPNPTSALSRLSHIPKSSCRRPYPGMAAACVSQTDGQIPLLAVFGSSTKDGFRSEMTWMGMESHCRLADDITPSDRSLRAGVDSQCERTGEAGALRDDIRLLTFLDSEIDAEVELQLLDDCMDSRGT